MFCRLGFLLVLLLSGNWGPSINIRTYKPLSTLTCGPIASAQVVEEFHVYGPTDLQKAAVDKFVERHKEDPTETMGPDSPFMEQARLHAIKRGMTKSDEELVVRKVASIDMGESTVIKQLPSPQKTDSDSILALSVSTQGERGLAPAEATALAVAFNEEIGMGAISKAGALPSGLEGQWITYVEEKLKREASLDHLSLLWEMGSDLTERAQKAQGGQNITFEEELLKNMTTWFESKGGKLHFSRPSVTPRGFRLVATEEFQVGEPVVSIPFHLIMCRQTARNVLIKKSSKYLGDELAKAFDKNEVWGLAIFVLHEYYKEVAGTGSKWGPFLRTLRMRFLSTDVIQVIVLA